MDGCINVLGKVMPASEPVYERSCQSCYLKSVRTLILCISWGIICSGAFLNSCSTSVAMWMVAEHKKTWQHNNHDKWLALISASQPPCVHNYVHSLPVCRGCTTSARTTKRPGSCSLEIPPSRKCTKAMAVSIQSCQEDSYRDITRIFRRIWNTSYIKKSYVMRPRE